jgi:hypothetical protein
VLVAGVAGDQRGLDAARAGGGVDLVAHRGRVVGGGDGDGGAGHAGLELERAG